MQKMTIRAINSTFASVSEGEFATIDDAYHSVLRAGLEIASGEVMQGSPSSTVELNVHAADGATLRRGAITVAAAQLLIAEASDTAHDALTA